MRFYHCRRRTWEQNQVFILPLLPPQNHSVRRGNWGLRVVIRPLFWVWTAPFLSKVTMDPAGPPGSINYPTILKQEEHYGGYRNIKLLFWMTALELHRRKRSTSTKQKDLQHPLCPIPQGMAAQGWQQCWKPGSRALPSPLWNFSKILLVKLWASFPS